MIRVWSLLSFFMIGVAIAPRPAAADVRRLVIVDMDENLEQAVETVLEPWSVAVIPVAPPGPGATVPASTRRARDMARKNAAGAVVWITGEQDQSEDSHTLWLYDMDSEKLVAVGLHAAPPYDEPTAAGVALSIKTLLRHSRVAPEEERLAVPASLDRTPVSHLAFELSPGVRMRGASIPAASGLSLEQRMTVGMLWYPSRISGWLHDKLALGAQLHAGPGLPVDVPSFVGHYTDIAVALGGRAHLPLGHRGSLTASLDGALHMTALDGVPLIADTSIHEQRLNPSLDAGLGLHVRMFATMTLGIFTRASFMARRQRYLVGPDVVLDLPSMELELALSLTLATR